MTVCRSTLASDRGEMDRALFLLSFSMERGVENLEPGRGAEDKKSRRVSFDGTTSFRDKNYIERK